MPELERPTAVNRELRAELVRRDIKHGNLASAVGLRPSQLSERLAGKTPWRLGELWAACDALGVQLSTLIEAAERSSNDRIPA